MLEERDVLLELPSFPYLPSDEADGAEEKGGNETAQEAFARRHDGLLRLWVGLDLYVYYYKKNKLSI